MNDTVIIDAMRWHEICHDLEFDGDRKQQFEDCFNCTVVWKSRLNQWPGEDVSERPNPIMVLRFLNPNDAVIFALRCL